MNYWKKSDGLASKIRFSSIFQKFEFPILFCIHSVKIRSKDKNWTKIGNSNYWKMDQNRIWTRAHKFRRKSNTWKWTLSNFWDDIFTRCFKIFIVIFYFIFPMVKIRLYEPRENLNILVSLWTWINLFFLWPVRIFISFGKWPLSWIKDIDCE